MMRLRPLRLLAMAFVATSIAACSDQDPDQPAVGSISVDGDRAPALEKKGKLGKATRPARP